MEYRNLGKTGLLVSTLSFGCGGVGGIMVSGDIELIMQVVSRAVDVGINYFDTAQIYGDGRSEENLGRILQVLKPEVVVGTKVQLSGKEMEHVENSIIAAAETSLRRLRVDRIDLLQLHNPLSMERNPNQRWIGLADLEPAVNAFQKLQASGKINYWGINGIGDTQAIHRGVESLPADTIQVCYNLLNPSAWYSMGQSFPFQDYRGLIRLATNRGIGIIAFRILAGGAISASRDRHPIAAQHVDPVATSDDYSTDVALAGHFRFLVKEHWASDLSEAAIRFALGRPEIATMPIGFSSVEQLDKAVQAIELGPLHPEALARLPGIWDGFSLE